MEREASWLRAAAEAVRSPIVSQPIKQLGWEMAKMLIGLYFYHDPNNSVGERSDSLLMRGLDVLQQPTFIVYRNDVT